MKRTTVVVLAVYRLQLPLRNNLQRVERSIQCVKMLSIASVLILETGVRHHGHISSMDFSVTAYPSPRTHFCAVKKQFFTKSVFGLLWMSMPEVFIASDGQKGVAYAVLTVLVLREWKHLFTYHFILANAKPPTLMSKTKGKRFAFGNEKSRRSRLHPLNRKSSHVDVTKSFWSRDSDGSEFNRKEVKIAFLVT
ncbi:unnamed protein product [Albugo candida]|uniref:Uncharacterized protein n=1 Tax=Albugo candida TaxID=65357 RepID=A0A024GUA3_9STRA|nr:unnamed protein product [Albugo candida]|eukprot:CCI50187.1 unnamed protein product [Albugo candida]